MRLKSPEIAGLALAAMLIGTPAAASTSVRGSRLVLAHWLPTVVPYSSGEDYLHIFQDDVRSALEAGIDGFAVDGFGNPLADQFLRLLSDAADAVGAPGFKIVLSADASLGFPAADIVADVAKYDANPHYLHIGGRAVLSTWNGGAYGDAWWKANVLAPLAAQGHPVVFLPTFIGRDGDPDASMPAEFPSADGFVHWFFAHGTPFRAGSPYYGNNAAYSELDGAEKVAASVHAAGKLWAGGVMPYYWASCHSVRQYYEWQGGRGMANAWASIMGPQAADMVELITWNDNTEGSYYQPTNVPRAADNGIPNFPHLGYYELSKYFIRWYKTGVRPTVTKDAIFWFHRTQKRYAAASADPCGIPINDAAIYGSAEDAIFVTTALTAPGTVRVTTGGVPKDYPVPAGIAHTNVPFNPGQQVITVWRGGTDLAGSVSNVEAAPTARNFNNASGYAVAGGGRSETWAPARAAPYAEWFK